MPKVSYTERFFWEPKKKKENGRERKRKKEKKKSNLELGLGLGLLENGLHLRRLHDVALDLELTAHEEPLGVGLAGDELAEVVVGKDEGDYHGTS
jgi:hypothetical protein